MNRSEANGERALKSYVRAVLHLRLNLVELVTVFNHYYYYYIVLPRCSKKQARIIITDLLKVVLGVVVG